MVKKVSLVVVMVLAMASLSNAQVFLTIDGNDAGTEVTLPIPSSTLNLDIDALPGLIGGDIGLVINNQLGSLNWSGAHYSTQWTSVYIPGVFTQKSDWNFPWGPLGTPGPYSGTITGGNFSSPTIINERLAWDIMFHCDAVGDLVVSLVSGGLNTSQGLIAAGTVLDTLTVHQLPEPMTLAVLGIGSLFLRRRK